MTDETKNARLTIDNLIKNAQMYSRGADYQELLDFVARPSNIAPFNALLSYLVCSRRGVITNSEEYLANFVSKNEYMPDVDLYHLMTAAGAVERILGISTHMQFKAP